MKRILVPTDFSEEARYALMAASGLARKMNAQINLLHVLEKREEEQEARDRIQEESRLLDLEEVVVKTFVTPGHQVEEITHFASDIIVMGSKGAHGLKSFFLGTHAESVAKHAAVPVITVKRPTDLTSIKRMIYATDLRDEQEEIIEDLLYIQRLYDANLHVVKVYDDAVVQTREVEKRMRAFAEKHGLRSYSVTARPGTNEIREILDFAEEMKADMVAMATHDRQGLERLFGGIISGAVINEINLPIWTKAILYSD